MNWERLQKIFFIVFLALIIGSLIIYQVYSGDFDLDKIQEYLKSFGIWAPLIFILLYTIGTVFIPATPFMVVAGLLFGFKYGILCTMTGGLLSSLIVFIIARKLGQEQIERILKNKYLKYVDKYNKRLGRNAVGDIIIWRIIPIMPFNILNILMGVSKTKTRDYIIGTLIGFIPSHVVIVYLGGLITKIL